MTVTHLLTGSYSSAAEPGIKLWQFDETNGTLAESASANGIERPSFIAVHPDGRSFVATSEVGNGDLVAYRLDLEANRITEINRQKSNGDHPAHVCIDEAGQWVLSVTYSGATVNAYPLREDGAIGELSDSVKHEGSGPNAERQDAAHPHSVCQVPGEDRFLVSDLGTDTIYVYRLDRESGKLNLAHTVQAKPGTGPRHLAFHPSERIVYSLGELDSSLAIYRLGESGTLKLLQTASLLPDDFEGENTSAEITVSADGRHVYASNRGHDSIVSFAVLEDGTVEAPQFTSAGGQGPRHFTLIEGKEWLIAANENSDSLTVLKISDGIPHLSGEVVNTKAPVCVKVVPQRQR